MSPSHSLSRRIRAYGEAVHLAQRGGSITEISNETGMPDATIRGWLRHGRRPWTRYELFRPTSSDQLSYVIGVYMGDGSISRWRNRFSLRLNVKDKEFADKFSSTCAQILGREPYSVRHVEDRDNYETNCRKRVFLQVPRARAPWAGSVRARASVWLCEGFGR